MVYRTLYQWYMKPPAYGILFDPQNPWYIKPLAYGILFDTTNPWYIEPPTHGISNHLPMVFCLNPPNPWYFVTKSYKDDHFAKTKTALKVQILESPASGLFYVTMVIVTY